jgi:hypothetical protein
MVVGILSKECILGGFDLDKDRDVDHDEEFL